MSKKDTPDVPVPALSLDPPTGDVATIPEPPAPDPSDVAPPKRKRHRRSKAELDKARAKEEAEQRAAAQAAGQASPEQLASCQVAIASLFELGSGIVAKRRGAHWQLDKGECEALAEVWTNALAPYLGKIGAAMPFAVAVAVTFGTLKPRLDQDAQLAGQNPAPPPPELVK